jgi:hypothetical protein
MRFSTRSDLIILERADTGMTLRAPCNVNADYLECIPKKSLRGIVTRRGSDHGGGGPHFRVHAEKRLRGTGKGGLYVARSHWLLLTKHEEIA